MRERGGKGGRASTRARARTEIVPSHGAQIEAEAVEREVGRVRVHHLELRRERNGGEGVRRGIFTKTTDGKARVAKFRPSPRSADRVFRGATGELLPAETKTFPFDGSVGSFRFREIRKVAKCKLSREITQRLNPGVSRSSLNRSGGSPHLACESGGPALRGARAARDARDRAGRAVDGRASMRPARNARPAGAARVRLPMRARAGRNLRRISRSPLNERSFRPRKVGCARAWPYRCVERPRGVRSNLGSDLGGFRAPCERREGCAKSCATRDEVSGERASRPRLSRVCFVCAD